MRPLKPAVKSQRTMGHRKELKNIAGGIILSFKSRNNDVDGYWELGKLYGYAKSCGTNTIELDLLNLRIKPDSNSFDNLLRLWRFKLESHLKSRSIPISCLKSVVITAKFNQKYEKRFHYWGSSLGDPCTCTCEIISDKGKVYSVTAGTNCRPHDPGRERRSTRRKGF
jgi:hypothetical protein